MKAWIEDVSSTRIKLLESREFPEGGIPSGSAGQGEAGEGISPVDPSPVLPGQSEPAGGIPAVSKDSMEVEPSAQELETREAWARISGPPPDVSTAGVATKRTHRYEQWLEGVLKATRDKLLHSGSLPQTADYSKSDAEKKTESSNQSFTGVSEETTGSTPNEDWITRSQQKFQIYVRRVVQFFILNISGLEEQLAPLRQANIQTILIKYKSLLSDAGWLLASYQQRFLTWRAKPRSILRCCRSKHMENSRSWQGL